MFKPHYGICICHNEKRLIVVKKGYCHEGNRDAKLDRNPKKIRPSKISDGYSSIIRKEGKEKKKIQHRREPTGELALFQEMWEEALDATDPQAPTCKCCGLSLGWEFNVSFFSHLLPKGLYPLYRLLRENIWIICFTCHFDWGNKSRAQPKFAEKNKEYERLKIQYNAAESNDKNISRMDGIS